MPVSVFAPAKLNLFLAITGRRPDGFHDLVSLVAPLDFGDTLRAEPAAEYSLICDNAEVPCDETNLVLKAARAFDRATANRAPRVPQRAKFMLEKRIPMGAGLGGGSSDGVAALRALNQLAEETGKLSAPELAAAAAELGSDCPLFLHGGPVILRGRGERVEPLPASVARRLSGQRVLVFKPDFPVATAWAYGQLAAAGSYLPAADAEARLAAWVNDSAAPIDALLFNNMESAAFSKFIALPVLLDRLRQEFGLAPRMSGSGSACFAFLRDDTDVAAVTAAIRSAWGESAFVVGARLT